MRSHNWPNQSLIFRCSYPLLYRHTPSEGVKRSQQSVICKSHLCLDNEAGEASTFTFIFTLVETLMQIRMNVDSSINWRFKLIKSDKRSEILCFVLQIFQAFSWIFVFLVADGQCLHTRMIKLELLALTSISIGNSVIRRSQLLSGVLKGIKVAELLVIVSCQCV